MDNLTHGSYSTYVNHKCRCDSCREAARDYQRGRDGAPRKRGRPPKEIVHGTVAGYNKKCRCEECTAAVREVSRKRRAAMKELPADDPRHGTVNAYYNLKCRCDSCKQAASEHNKERKSQGLEPGDPRHGTHSGYANSGCRCDECRKAATDYQRENGYARRNALSKYGLTPETWEDLFNSQGRKCASCGDPEPAEGEKRFHVDHDHDTGETRKILCHGCNVALGLLKDDIRRIYALADYLAEYKPY